MAGRTSIEWTDSTWNPVTGCTKISPGCAHCYAERMSRRLRAMGNPRYYNEFDVTLHSDLVNLPLRWRNPRVIFVNSMSDLFHEKVSLSFIKDVFSTMEAADWHIFQVLTKRADRLQNIASELPWPRNVWMGVTVECSDYAWRIDCLRRTPAAVKFLSCEPLIGPSSLDLAGIDWVVVGGESGPGARPMSIEWARLIRDECKRYAIPFFLKQLGGVLNKRGKTQAVMDGKLWHQVPDALQKSYPVAAPQACLL